MMEFAIGAAIFAVGCLFGAWLVLAGQQSKTDRTSRKIRENILKSMEKAANERTHN